ncbi:hypothetical protein SELMODRAFT_80096 [Selaginella moellendorffii]|uniref:Uncharacterized protein n=1 Tax=Selaginella moellendorffii TaxID=88036 RepID=D8QX42_SELML|nr:hypothetical protein SELMODRAFT_80096 [Selaginella moellendorffii]
MGVLRRIKTSQQRSSDGNENENTLPRIGDGVEEPVTPAGRLFLQPDFYLTAQCILGFQNPIDLPALKSELSNTLAKHPRFSSLMRLNARGREIWVRTHVNIDDHIIVADLSRFPRDSPTIVEDYTAELSAARLDASKPLWEVHVLAMDDDRPQISLRGGARGVCILVFHHALGDGTSLMSLFLASTRQLENPAMLPTIPRPAPAPQNDLHPLAWIWRSLVPRLWRLVLVAWFSITEIVKFLCMQAWVKDSRSCLRGYRGAENEPSRLAIADLKLDDVKRVKNAANATVNDVLLAIVSIALQKYLTHHAQTGSDNGNHCKFKTKWLKSLSIRALVMVNTRPSPGLQEVNEMMNTRSKARWGNSLGYMLVPLSVNKVNAPTHPSLEHVHHAKSISTRKKLSYEAKLTYSGGVLLIHLLGIKVLSEHMTYRAALHTTLTISNIVGPVETVTFAGNPLLYIIPTSSGLPQGLLVHMTSYANDVRIAVMAKEKIVPDVSFLRDSVYAAMDTLLRDTT